MAMQRFTRLECNGVVDIIVSVADGGVHLSGTEPFLCETEDTKIVVRSKPGFNGGITMTNGTISVIGCSNIYNSFNSINGCTFIQSNKGGGTQRIIIDGVDVTSEVRQVVDKKKGGIATEEADDCKREYILSGIVALSDISVSGSSQCVVQDDALLDADSMELHASGSAGLYLPPCKIDRLDISTSGCAKISGDVTVRRLVVKSSDTASVRKFYATASAKLKASGCASIVVGVSAQASVDRNTSGSANIVVTK